jgi:toxin-antitoxin system PIN domain toxin
VIAVETNILVYAHRRDAEFHAAASACVRELAEGRAQWAIPWPCLHEFLAIVTHPLIYDPPSTLEQACTQVGAWLGSPTIALLRETHDHWRVLESLLRASRVGGAAVHDARVAALCIGYGVAELWTLDRDFGRFPGLRTRNPLQ